MELNIFSEDIIFDFKDNIFLKLIINKIAEIENISFKDVNLIFCSDQFLKDINIKYLKRDYLTDIITFPYSEDPTSGDIFISIDRIKENASIFQVQFVNELRRVIIHGFLHLCGYEDYDDITKNQMTLKEDFYLNILG